MNLFRAIGDLYFYHLVTLYYTRHCLVQDDLKLPDESGEVPKAKENMCDIVNKIRRHGSCGRLGPIFLDFPLGCASSPKGGCLCDPFLQLNLQIVPRKEKKKTCKYCPMQHSS